MCYYVHISFQKEVVKHLCHTKPPWPQILLQHLIQRTTNEPLVSPQILIYSLMMDLAELPLWLTMDCQRSKRSRSGFRKLEGKRILFTWRRSMGNRRMCLKVSSFILKSSILRSRRILLNAFIIYNVWAKRGNLAVRLLKTWPSCLFLFQLLWWGLEFTWFIYWQGDSLPIYTFFSKNQMTIYGKDFVVWRKRF